MAGVLALAFAAACTSTEEIVSGSAVAPGAPPSATSGPTPSPSAQPDPPVTATVAPTATTDPSTPTPTPLISGTVKVLTILPPEFVDNEDCADVNREPLDTGMAIVSQDGHGFAIAVEIARTPAEQSQGLMCRPTFTGDRGMIFTWDTDRTGAFWMYNTYAPLDIIYFGGENGGVTIREMEPCPRAEGETDPDWSGRCSQASVLYQSLEPYRHALELPHDWLESRGFDHENPDSIVVSLSIGE